MKMQKSTMILTGVLGVISVGSVLMFANPGMQEALVSNIFRSQPVMPSTPAGTTKGKYESFISTENITKEAAYSNCMQNSSNNTKSSIRCTWNNVEIFSRGVVPTPTTPANTGSTAVTATKPIQAPVTPKPTTPANTGSTAIIEGNMVITINGKDQPAFYNTSKFGETYANLYCTEYAKLVPTTSKFSCIWNGSKELSKGYGTQVTATKPIQAPVTPKPTTPANTGSTAITEGNIVITINGKDQPSFLNTSKFGEAYANLFCTEYAKLVPTTSKFSCIWNGSKELSKGYGTQVTATKPIQAPVAPKPTAPANTGSTTNNSGTMTLGTLTINTNFSIDKSARYNIAETEAKAVCESTWKKYENDPKSTQLTCAWNGKTIFSKTKPTTPTTPVYTGGISTGSVSTGQLLVYADGQLFSSVGMHNNITKDSALTICKGYIPNLGMMVKVECKWNNVVIFTGLGTKPEFKILINGFLVESKVGVTRQFASEQCEKTQVNTSTNKTVSCIWNDVTLYSGKGKQVVVQTNSGSVSSGTVAPLATLTMTSNYWGVQTQTNTSESGAIETCNSTWKKYETNSQYTTLTCSWNGKVIFSKTKPSSTSTGSTSTGTVVVPKTPTNTGSTSTGVTNSGSTTSLGKMDMWVNGQAWNPEYNISQSGALTKCTHYLPSIPTSSVVLCKWNGTTIYSGNGKQVVTQTNSGSTSSGSTSTGNATTTKKLTSSDIVVKNLDTENTTRTTRKIRYSITNNSSSDIVVYNHQFSFENPSSDTQDFSKVRFVGAFGADNTYLAEKVGSNLTFASQVGIKRGETKIFLFDVYASGVDSIHFYIDLISMYITDNNGTTISVAPQLRYKSSIYNK